MATITRQYERLFSPSNIEILLVSTYKFQSRFAEAKAINTHISFFDCSARELKRFRCPSSVVNLN
ncbi:hypothetical protein CW304_27525 [Bacillus sp. UFRGS-B20]|nr:hypothetical protein CW304_27525 [Bacillus sp. UFRGS-B20]